VRKAAHEVGRAVERIDDPGRLRGASLGGSGLLTQEDVAGKRAEQDLAAERLALLVGPRDDVVSPLLLDVSGSRLP
jgi:hypothetical protein